MDTFKSFEDVLYEVNDQNFEDIALRLFRFQFENNRVFRDFVSHVSRGKPKSIDQIPFLPISFFKSHEVKTGDWDVQEIFSSSGTTGQTSRHLVKDPALYLSNTERIFTEFFGPLTNFHVLALLPSYLERDGSSLVYMADYFIKKSKSEYSGFYLDELSRLVETLIRLKTADKKVLLLGVTFALLDLAEQYPIDLSHCIIMETGGMKGRRKELTREEVHANITSKLHVPAVLSEYGMTELLSQAYSLGYGKFNTPTTMKIKIRDINDPFEAAKTGKTGAINVIDLANIYSCAFVETQDLGKINQDGSFEVLGRMDNSDVRGCNLLVE